MLPAATDSRENLFPQWRFEIRFLLGHLGTTGFSQDLDPAYLILPDGFDWEYLLATASLHGVLPLFFRSISKSGPGSVPTAILERTRREYGVISRRNFIFAQELLRLLAYLNDHGIAVVPYKGAPLAEMAYGDLSLRQFSDLDILVRPADVFNAKRLLEEQGYQTRFIYGRRPLSQLTPAETATFIKYRHEFEMQRKDGLLIDLHWQLAPRHYPFRLATGPLWERSETVAFAGRSISSFGREDLVLILCMHGAKDRWKKLIWIIDLTRIIVNDRALDWDSIFSRARDAHMELPLLLGLQLVEDLFAPDMPSRVDRGRESRDQIARLARTIFAELFRENKRPERFPVRLLHLRLCRDFNDKLSYSWQAFFVPRVGDWAVVRLPAWLYPLYYVLRPFHILGIWAWSSIRSRLKEQQRSTDRKQL
ncbi:MAG: nucleotidyltransferase family protein [Gammaproteobacteria bacterium]|nr:nucleotidyltransferase family protein [Gammaproteobacteria bacterium]